MRVWSVLDVRSNVVGLFRLTGESNRSEAQQKHLLIKFTDRKRPQMDRKTTGVENWKPHESPEIVSLIKNFQKKILVSRTIRADKREKKKLFGKRDTLFAVGVCVFPKKRRQKKKKKNFRRNFPSHQQRRQ